MPLHLPKILHDFLMKHYKYLPEFDGKPEGPTNKKHLQDFEYFLDLFEIEHDDILYERFFPIFGRPCENMVKTFTAEIHQYMGRFFLCVTVFLG